MDFKRLLEESQREIASAAVSGLPGRSAARELFMQPQVPTFGNLLDEYSAEALVASFIKEVRIMQADAPPDKVLVVTMLTPDGRDMDVATIKAAGANGFVATGLIERLPCTVFGHVSTFRVFCAFEARSKRTRLGFIVEVPEPAVTEPQTEPEPQASGKKKPARGRAKR
jgi:hypothetical protein